MENRENENENKFEIDARGELNIKTPTPERMKAALKAVGCMMIQVRIKRMLMQALTNDHEESETDKLVDDFIGTVDYACEAIDAMDKQIEIEGKDGST